jgi:recombination protein RecA
LTSALGVGGFARGRIVEVYGPESSGKTTLTLTVIAQAQKGRRSGRFHRRGARARSPNYARKLGVKMDEIARLPARLR